MAQAGGKDVSKIDEALKLVVKWTASRYCSGGRTDMAQAGGKDVSKIDEALKLAVRVTSEQIM